MNILIFGPPGIGKGTVSELLKKKLKIPHIATGDILRGESKKPDSKLKQYMEKGFLVPDEIVSEIVKERLQRKDCKKGFILDGFPRTLKQAEFLKNDEIKIDKVINMDTDINIIIERLSGRLVCPNCGSIYHIKNIPPKKNGICDKCNSKLIQRADDKPEIIKKRIEVYKKDTKPILEHYKKEDIVEDIDGGTSLNKVFDDIIAVL